jgi:Outer membrane protein beta-barrel domain
VRKLVLAVIAVVGLVGAARPAHAEWVWVNRQPNPYARPHFYLGAEAQGLVVLGATGPRAFLDHGGGFDLFLGGRLNRWAALEFGWQPTFHNPEQDVLGRQVGRVGLQALTIDAKFYPAHGRVQPYLSAGAGLYLLGDNFSVFAEGPGFQVGGGIDFWLSRWASLGVRAQYRGVDMVDYDAGNDDTYLSLLSFGVDFTGRF